MLKIISSKVAARKTIKAQLKKEIPPINEAIEKAAAEKRRRFYYDGPISEPTAKMLTKAGYIVEDWDVYDVRTEIAWNPAYNKLAKKDSAVEELAKEVNVKIVERQ